MTPLGWITVGPARFPVDQLALTDGALCVSGELTNPFPDGRRGAGFPTGYQLTDPAGVLVWEGPIPRGAVGHTDEDMTWRFTVKIDFGEYFGWRSWR